MRDAIQCLRAEGKKTAVVTNNFWMDREHRKPTHPLDTSLFDAVIIFLSHYTNQMNSYFPVVESCRLGMRKPDERIYRHVLELLHVSADEAAFLDDIGNNLKSARHLGMHTIQVLVL